MNSRLCTLIWLGRSLLDGQGLHPLRTLAWLFGRTQCAFFVRVILIFVLVTFFMMAAGQRAQKNSGQQQNGSHWFTHIRDPPLAASCSNAW
jgi:hypothetical protein